MAAAAAAAPPAAKRRRLVVPCWDDEEAPARELALSLQQGRPGRRAYNSQVTTVRREVPLHC